MLWNRRVPNAVPRPTLMRCAPALVAATPAPGSPGVADGVPGQTVANPNATRALVKSSIVRAVGCGSALKKNTHSRSSSPTPHLSGDVAFHRKTVGGAYMARNCQVAGVRMQGGLVFGRGAVFVAQLGPKLGVKEAAQRLPLAAGPVVVLVNRLHFLNTFIVDLRVTKRVGGC